MIYLYIGNHGKGLGIKTFIKIFKNLFPNIRIVNKIKINHINILIENFNCKDVRKIIWLKKNTKTKFILLCTEYYNRNANTFNSFEFNSYYSNFFININYLIIEMIKKFIPLINIRKNKNKNFISKNIRSKNFLINYLSKLIILHNYKKRYLNFNKVQKYIDLFLITHPEIKKGINSKKKILLIPYIINFKNINKVNDYGFSGALTKYRYELYCDLYKNIKKNLQLKKFLKNTVNLQNKFLYKDNYSTSGTLKQNYFFSFHTKRASNWPFVSPVRIVNSLENGEVPVLHDNFYGSFLKEVVYHLKKFDEKSINLMVQDKNKIKSKIKKKISNFNKKNQIIFKDLKKEIKNLL